MISKRVVFKKPNFKKLNPDYNYVDMHYHSRYSDTFTKIKTILKRAEKKGIGVSLTDHNEIKGCVRAYLENKSNNIIVPGIEVGAKEGPHVLIYFYSIGELIEYYDKHIKNFKGNNPFMATKVPLDDVVHNARNFNSLIFIAHPGLRQFNILKKISEGRIKRDLLEKVHGFEVLCGQNFRKHNKKTIEFASVMGKSFVGGSDGHVLRALGSTLTFSEADDLDGFLDNIRKKNNFVMGKEMKLLPRLHPYTKMATKHVKYLKSSIVTHVNYSWNEHKYKKEARKRKKNLK